MSEEMDPKPQKAVTPGNWLSILVTILITGGGFLATFWKTVTRLEYIEKDVAVLQTRTAAIEKAVGQMTEAKIDFSWALKDIKAAVERNATVTEEIRTEQKAIAERLNGKPPTR